MILQLLIDEKRRQEWYLDDAIVFRKVLGIPFEMRCDYHKDYIDRKVADIKNDYWQDIEAADSWAIIIKVESQMNMWVDQNQRFNNYKV